MVDKLKVINFLQDFGCARLSHLQILYDDKNNNFKNILGNTLSLPLTCKKNLFFLQVSGKLGVLIVEKQNVTISFYN